MNALCRRTVACALAGAALLFGSGLWPSVGQAAPGSVEAFDTGAWTRLQATQKLPTAVVFSTTDCVHCPAVIEQLVRDLGKRKLKANVIAVVMDAAPGKSDASLLAEPHYRQADRLFAFSGPTNSLRYAVDPRWRGVTPFVALWVPGGPVRFVTGAPSEAQVQAWIGAPAPSSSTR